MYDTQCAKFFAGFHSINTQIICDSNLKILHVFPNFGGATHDSYIWNNSTIKTDIEGLRNNGEVLWLIGDSGYAQSSVVMTPFRNPVPGTPEYRYTEAHIRARNTVERCIGLLKVRFRCILKERTARYSPEMVSKFVKVCAALHNMCLGMEVNEYQPQIEEEHGFNEMEQNILDYEEERYIERDEVVRRYFR